MIKFNQNASDEVKGCRQLIASQTDTLQKQINRNTDLLDNLVPRTSFTEEKQAQHENRMNEFQYIIETIQKKLHKLDEEKVNKE